MKNNNLKVVGGVLAGVVAGSVVALLTTPDTGKNIRKKIGQEASKLKDHLDDGLAKTLETVKTAYHTTVSDVTSRIESEINSSNLQLKGNWNEIKGDLKKKYAQLTDTDLTYTEGKGDELLGRLQKKIGKSKDELKKEIESMS